MPKGRKFRFMGIGHNISSCSICDYQVSSVTGIKLHMRKCHNGNAIRNDITNSKCSVCGYRSSSISELKKHFSTHS